MIADNGNIKAISGGKVYALYTEEVKDKEDKVVGTALKIGKDKTFANFVYSNLRQRMRYLLARSMVCMELLPYSIREGFEW